MHEQVFDQLRHCLHSRSSVFRFIAKLSDSDNYRDKSLTQLLY